MVSKNKPILEAALALPEQERAELVVEILESLSGEEQELTEDELAAELDRRSEELRNDPGASIPWSQLKDEE